MSLLFVFTLGRDRFLRRFVLHVLPARFWKVRHYGFLSLTSAVFIEPVCWRITLDLRALAFDGALV